MIKFCKKCQTETEHYTGGACKPCAHVRQAKYRASNLDKVMAVTAKWHAKNPERVRLRKAKYYADNADRLRAKNVDWKAAHPEYNAEWRMANPEYAAKYRKDNKEKCQIYCHNRRSRIASCGGELSPGLTAKLFNLQKGKCPCCKLPLGGDFHLDHRMPLALGGSNTDDNMQLLRATCNHQKHAKHPADFMRKRGFLL